MKKGNYKIKNSILVFTTMAALMIGVSPIQKYTDISATSKEELETNQEELNRGNIEEKGSTYTEEILNEEPHDERIYVLATDSDFSGTTNGTFKYIGNDEYVEIPHTIKGANVTSYSNLFANTSVKGVKSTNKNVTNMSSMFYGVTSEDLDVSELDTSSVTTMSSMFRNANAKKLDLSNFDTSKVTNMTNMFYGTSATEINVSSFDTSNVMYTSYMFRDSSVEVLDLRSFDTSEMSTTSTTSTRNMFYGTKATLGYARTKADSIWLGNNEGKPRDLGFTIYKLAEDKDFEGESDGNFKYIGKDSYIEIPHTIKGVNVTSYKNMFEGTSIRGVKSTNPNVKDMSGMFKNTTTTELDLTALDTSNVIHTDNMFEGARATIGYSKTPEDTIILNKSTNRPIDLEFTHFVMAKDNDFRGTSNGSFRYVGGDAYVEIPHTIKGANVTSYSNLFANTSVKGVKSTNKNVTNMSSMFSGSTSEDLDVSELDTSNVTTMTSMFRNAEAKKLDLSNFDTSKVTSMHSMFYGTSATEINVSSFDTSNVMYTSSMFRDSSVEVLDLRSFDISKLNTSSGLTDMFMGTKATIGYTRTQDIADRFNRTNKPTALVFTPYILASDSDFSGTTNGSFKYIGTEDYVEIPHVIKGVNVTSYAGMFEGTTIEGVKSTNVNVTDMNGMFKYSTRDILDLRWLDTSGVTNMSQMFMGTKAIKINVENFNTSNVRDMSQMFMGTKAIKINVENFNTSKVRDMSQMFKDTSLENVNVLNFDTVNVENMGGMFENLQVAKLDLSTFDISNVTQIGEMFKGVTATLGYARTPEDAEKMNNSEGKPEELDFDIYRVTLTPDKVDWTRGNVRITTELIKQVHSIHLPDGTEVKEDDIKDGENIEYDATDNGTQTFKVNYKVGFSVNEEYEVTNIDNELPTLTITGIPDSYVEGEYITLTLVAEDELSGVRRITLPDGSTTTLTTTTFKVRENGEYQFRVTDNVGNVYTEVVTIDKMMIPFTAYVKDAKGEVIAGAKYELLRDGEVYRDNTSNKAGLVNFGRIPQEGEYKIRQVTTPDGYELSKPEEVLVEYLIDETTIVIPISEELETPIIKLDTNEWVNSNIIAEVLYDETSDIKIYKIGEGNWRRYTRELSIPSNTEIYTRSYDTKGSWSPIGEVTINNIDKIRPTLEIEQDDREWVGDSVRLTVRATDKQSGIEELMSGEDLELVDSIELADGIENTYKVVASGVYRFVTKDNAGNTSLETHTVTNIDKTPPTINVTGNPSKWYKGYDLDLTVEVKDTGSGVESVTLPDGTILYGEDAKEFTYTVGVNGDYEFTAVDKVGNTTTHVEEVTRLEKDYSVHVVNNKGIGLEGIEFEFYRDDELLGTYVSDSEGKVDFGKVYTSGKYELKQNGVLEGYRLNNQIIEVDVTEDNFKVINYLKTQEMPGTGTLSMLVVGIALTLGVSGLYVINRRKKGLYQ